MHPEASSKSQRHQRTGGGRGRRVRVGGLNGGGWPRLYCRRWVTPGSVRGLHGLSPVRNWPCTLTHCKLGVSCSDHCTPPSPYPVLGEVIWAYKHCYCGIAGPRTASGRVLRVVILPQMLAINDPVCCVRFTQPSICLPHFV